MAGVGARLTAITVFVGATVLACGAIIGIDDRTLDTEPALPARADADALEGGEASDLDVTVEATAPCPVVGCSRCVGPVCEIDCPGPNCPPRLTCPAGVPCLVRCRGARSCEKRDIDCSTATSCKIECLDGSDACNDTKIVSQAVPTCIECRGPQSCDAVSCNGSCSKVCTGNSCSSATCSGCATVSACP